ncbi:MAG: glycosyltransferase family 4 protein [Acidimicrobiia bacterium]
MKKKHVLIIVQNLSVPYDRRVWLECNSLIDNGFEVSVICPRAKNDSKKETLNGVNIYRYAPPPATASVFSFLLEFSYCFIRTFILAIKIHLKKRINIIQTCNPPDTYWLLGLFFKLFGVSFVFDQHDLCPEVFDARFGESQSFSKRILRSGLVFLEKMNYSVASKVISTNESYFEIATSRGKKKKEDVVIVRSGPNPDRLYPIEKDESLLQGKKYMLVYIGVMGPQDRVDIAIDAMNEIVNSLDRKDVKLALLGDGDCFNELQNQTKELGLENYVEFLGKANDEVIRKYFSSASIGIAPDPATKFNSHSTHNKIMEYMIFSLPIVCFELKETIKSGQDALSIVEENADPVAMAKAIVALLDDEEAIKSKGLFGRDRVLKHLTWEHQSQAYVDVFKSFR